MTQKWTEKECQAILALLKAWAGSEAPQFPAVRIAAELLEKSSAMDTKWHAINYIIERASDPYFPLQDRLGYFPIALEAADNFPLKKHVALKFLDTFVEAREDFKDFKLSLESQPEKTRAEALARMESAARMVKLVYDFSMLGAGAPSIRESVTEAFLSENRRVTVFDLDKAFESINELCAIRRIPTSLFIRQNGLITAIAQRNSTAALSAGLTGLSRKGPDNGLAEPVT
jgi:hypothetical protein